MLKKTKMICTVGPATDSVELLVKMLQSGMNLARFNFSHGSHEEHRKRIEMVREAARIADKPVALICDTKGPEMRLGMFKDGSTILKDGSTFILTTETMDGTAEMASVNYPGLPEEVKPGTDILLSDGMLSLKVEKVEGHKIYTKVTNGGKISSRKRVACPGIELKLPFMSEQDKSDILFAVEMDMDYIAASFVQNAGNVFEIRRLLESQGSKIGIISKIENRAGVDHIDDIIKASNGVMVARGDLGVEIPAEEVPMVQKSITKACNRAGKPVITATQMLESMTESYRCTRAEASDVANAILDGTDVVMLSGETASGKYPLEAVQTMAAIALSTEKALNYPRILQKKGLNEKSNSSDAISHAAVQIAQEIEASAIVAITQTGATAMNMSKYRSPAHIVALCRDTRIVRMLQLFWGVIPLAGAFYENSDVMIDMSVKAALAKKLVSQGDSVVVTAGIPTGIPGSTNMIKVVHLGQKLLTGIGISKRTVNGKVCHCVTEADFKDKLQKGMILVVKSLSDEQVKYATKAAAIITEEKGLTSAAAILGINSDLPVIVNAGEASKILTDVKEITVDTATGTIYEGNINV